MMSGILKERRQIPHMCQNIFIHIILFLILQLIASTSNTFKRVFHVGVATDNVVLLEISVIPFRFSVSALLATVGTEHLKSLG
jgi:hypothetical protein